MIDWIPYRGREQWHELRAQGIGGSDVASILGLSKYRSAHGVWAEKVGIRKQQPRETMNQKAGKVLEPMIAARLQRHHGLHLARVNAMAVSQKHPHRRANIDRAMFDKPRDLSRPGDAVRYADGIAEIKTASPFVRDRWAHGVPDYYAVQCQYYLGLLGLPRAVVAVWFLGDAEIETFELERDDPAIAEIFEAVDAFWHGHVVTNEAPPLTGNADDLAELGRRLAEQRASETVQLDAEGATLIAEYVQAKQRLDAAKRDVDECKARAGQLLEAAAAKRAKGDAGAFAVVANERIDNPALLELARSGQIDLPEYERTIIDYKQIAADYPELAKAAKKPNPYIRFWPA